MKAVVVILSTLLAGCTTDLAFRCRATEEEQIIEREQTTALEVIRYMVEDLVNRLENLKQGDDDG